MRRLPVLAGISAALLIAGGATLLASATTQTARTRSASRPAPKEPPLPEVTLPTDPGLYAVIYTSMGNIVCRLLEKEAPKTVANFNGLAKGTKRWTDPASGKPMRTALYTGTTFHRVIP